MHSKADFGKSSWSDMEARIDPLKRLAYCFLLLPLGHRSEMSTGVRESNRLLNLSKSNNLRVIKLLPPHIKSHFTCP